MVLNGIRSEQNLLDELQLPHNDAKSLLTMYMHYIISGVNLLDVAQVRKAA